MELCFQQNADSTSQVLFSVPFPVIGHHHRQIGTFSIHSSSREGSVPQISFTFLNLNACHCTLPAALFVLGHTGIAQLCVISRINYLITKKMRLNVVVQHDSCLCV